MEKQEGLLKHMDKELQELHATHKQAIDDLNLLVRHKILKYSTEIDKFSLDLSNSET